MLYNIADLESLCFHSGAHLSALSFQAKLLEGWFILLSSFPLFITLKIYQLRFSHCFAGYVKCAQGLQLLA